LIMKLRRMYDLVQKPILMPHLTKYTCKFNLEMKEKVICLALFGYYILDLHFVTAFLNQQAVKYVYHLLKVLWLHF